MELVIDANILMSALIASNGVTFDLIFDEKLRLFSPEFLFKEIEKHKDEIMFKSGLLESEFDFLFSILYSKIDVIQKKEFESFIDKTKEITPDENDTEYLALAFKMNCSLWSNDKILKEQKYIHIVNTSELIKLLSDNR